MTKLLMMTVVVLFAGIGGMSTAPATEAVDPNGPPPPFDAPEETMLPLPDGGAGAWYTGLYSGPTDPNFGSVSYTTTLLPDFLLHNERQEFIRIRPIYRASNYTIMVMMSGFKERNRVRYEADFAIFSLRADGPTGGGLTISRCGRTDTYINPWDYDWPTARFYEKFLSLDCVDDIRQTIAGWEGASPSDLQLPNESHRAKPETAGHYGYPIPRSYFLPFEPGILDREKKSP